MKFRTFVVSGFSLTLSFAGATVLAQRSSDNNSRQSAKVGDGSSSKEKSIVTAPVKSKPRIQTRSRDRAVNTSRWTEWIDGFDKRVNLSYGSWREVLSYETATYNYLGKASFAGFFFKGELSKYADFVNWGLTGSFFYGNADGKSDDTSSYRVNKVSAQAFGLSPFCFFEVVEGVRLKLALDVNYKVISWPSTAGAYSVKTNPLTYGPNVGLEYRVWKNWSIEQRLGTYSPAGEVFWQVGATYLL